MPSQYSIARNRIGISLLNLKDLFQPLLNQIVRVLSARITRDAYFIPLMSAGFCLTHFALLHRVSSPVYIKDFPVYILDIA